MASLFLVRFPQLVDKQTLLDHAPESHVSAGFEETDAGDKVLCPCLVGRLCDNTGAQRLRLTPCMPWVWAVVQVDIEDEFLGLIGSLKDVQGVISLQSRVYIYASPPMEGGSGRQRWSQAWRCRGWWRLPWRDGC